MTVSSYLKNLSDNAIIRDQEKESIRTSITTLKRRLESHFGDKIKDQFIFGSYTRNTILPRSMDARSDIDYMIVFNDDVTPQSYLNRLKRFVETYYSSSERKQSHPSIKLDLNHITFELVPALENFWGGYKIPGRNHVSDDWMDTNPNDFNQELTDKNKEHGSLIKPVIRLMKYWNVQNGYIYDSFKLEKWIIERNFTGLSILYTQDLKRYFFKCIEELGAGHLTETNKNKVNRAKSIVTEVRKLETDGYIAIAENKIKKLLPELIGHVA